MDHGWVVFFITYSSVPWMRVWPNLKAAEAKEFITVGFTYKRMKIKTSKNGKSKYTFIYNFHLGIVSVRVAVSDGADIELLHVILAQHQGQPLVIGDVLRDSGVG